MKMKTLQIVLGMSLIGLTACNGGATHYQRSKMQVSAEFLDGLIMEQPGVAEQFPYTATVVDDWIVQNEPKPAAPTR